MKIKSFKDYVVEDTKTLKAVEKTKKYLEEIKTSKLETKIGTRYIFKDGSYALVSEDDKRIGYYDKNDDFIGVYSTLNAFKKCLEQSGLI